MNERDYASVRDDSTNTITGSKLPAVQFDTCCFEKLLPLDVNNDSLERTLRRDAELIDVPDEAETFWVSSDAQPTTALEKIAKAVFDFHVANLPVPTLLHRSSVLPGRDRDGNTPTSNSKAKNTGEASDGDNGKSPGYELAFSGAEWWIQIREEGYHSDLGMPFHWDKDERLRETTGVMKYPEVSTVTYLTEHGAPTMVLESCATEQGVVVEGRLRRAFLSYPSLFKHLAFDGRFLHGVPEIMTRKYSSRRVDSRSRSQQYPMERHPDPEQGHGALEPGSSGRSATLASAEVDSAASCGQKRARGRMRVTLLVNVWLSHKPLEIAPLPQAIAAMLSRAPDLPVLNFDHPVMFSPVRLPVNDAVSNGDDSDRGVALTATVAVKMALGTATFLEMCVPRSETMSEGKRRGLHAFLLQLEDGFRARISGVGRNSSCGSQVRRDADLISCPAQGFDENRACLEEQVGFLAEEHHDHLGSNRRWEGLTVDMTANGAREKQDDTAKRKRDIT